MSDALAFAAHLAALVSAPDPDHRSAGRALGAVVLAWTQLAASAEPQFQLDTDSLTLGRAQVALPVPWANALRGLHTSLNARGVAAVRLVGPIERGTVLAFLRAANTTPVTTRREELQAWLAGHGGASVQLLGTRLPVPRDARAALLASFDAWDALAGAEDLPPGTAAHAVRGVIDRVEEDPSGLATVLAFVGPRPARRQAAVAVLALLIGSKLGLGRRALLDLGLTALALARLPWPLSEGSQVEAVQDQCRGSVGRTEARTIVAAWGLRPPASHDSHRHPHLFARVLALADEADAELRGDEARANPSDRGVTRILGTAGHRHQAALVAALLEVVGRWPVGTTLVLDSGEVGVVCRAPASPQTTARPVIRVVVDRAGALLEGGPLLDLSQGALQRTRILGSLDPRTVGVNVTAAVCG